MNNHRHEGVVLTLTAPAGGVVSGGFYIIGGIGVVAVDDADAAASFEGQTSEVFDLTKTNPQAWAEGDAIYWDETNSRADNDSSIGVHIGSASEAAASATATGEVALKRHGADSRALLNRRQRVTLAELNAGITLIPGIAGRQLRMVSCEAIAIGGAAGALTTADVLSLQGAASVKLAAFAQASLLEDAQLRAGDAGGADLAGGLSFVANDAGAPITAGVTGADMTVATHIDFNISYTVD